jgi:alkylhydroperoxidase family enzyme
MDPQVVQAVLTDWRTAPIPERTRAILGFLEALTLRPREVSGADVRPLLELGLEPDAIREAIYVCFLFNVLNRCADSMSFDPASGLSVRRIGFTAHWLGYGGVQLPG